MERLSLLHDKSQYVGSFKIKVEGDKPIVKPKPSDTAEHEAMHVIAGYYNGNALESASIIPGPGYLGITKLSKPDAVAALGPHSMGKSGTGHDVYIANVIGGAGAESAARSIINSHQEEVNAVAQALEEKKTIGHSDAVNAIHTARMPKFETARLIIQDKDGKQEVFGGLSVLEGDVFVPRNLFSRFKNPNDESRIH